MLKTSFDSLDFDGDVSPLPANSFSFVGKGAKTADAYDAFSPDGDCLPASSASYKAGLRSSVFNRAFEGQAAKGGGRQSVVFLARFNLSNTAHSALYQQRFDTFMGVIILINSLMIGVEASCHEGASCYDQVDPRVFSIAEHVFLVIYILELTIRLYAFGVNQSIASPWVRFDCFLVISGVVSTWILAPLLKDDVFMSSMPVLKVLRVVRLARACRLLVQFRDLWILVRGLLSSFAIMVWSISLIFVLMFVFAVLGIEFIGTNTDLTDDPDIGELAVEQFGTLAAALLTLSSFWLVDNIGKVYIPIINKFPLLIPYFLSFIIVISISCMNLVTAIMVQNAISSAQQDKEATNAWELQRRRELVPKLIEIFRKLDTDGSSTLTKVELANATPEVADALKQVGNTDDTLELFDILDVDGTGSIGIDEFCAGMLKQSSDPDRPIEFLRMSKQLDNIHRMLNDFKKVAGYDKKSSSESEATETSGRGGRLSAQLRNVQQLYGGKLPKSCILGNDGSQNNGISSSMRDFGASMRSFRKSIFQPASPFKSSASSRSIESRDGESGPSDNGDSSEASSDLKRSVTALGRLETSMDSGPLSSDDESDEASDDDPQKEEQPEEGPAISICRMATEKRLSSLESLPEDMVAVNAPDPLQFTISPPTQGSSSNMTGRRSVNKKALVHSRSAPAEVLCAEVDPGTQKPGANTEGELSAVPISATDLDPSKEIEAFLARMSAKFDSLCQPLQDLQKETSQLDQQVAALGRIEQRIDRSERPLLELQRDVTRVGRRILRRTMPDSDSVAEGAMGGSGETGNVNDGTTGSWSSAEDGTTGSSRCLLRSGSLS